MPTFSRGFGPVSAATVNAAEKRLGVKFPTDYERFLRATNGGCPTRYRFAEERNAELRATDPDAPPYFYARLREGGPATGVKWAEPLLPGVLVADSYEVMGPTSERATAKVLLYYGGVVTLCELWGIIA